MKSDYQRRLPAVSGGGLEGQIGMRARFSGEEVAPEGRCRVYNPPSPAGQI